MIAGAAFDGTRREFLKQFGRIGIGLGAVPVFEDCTRGQAHLTILHTSDIHAQLSTHDEFFWEDGKAVFRRRGGFATLRTMIEALRRQNPGNTLLVDGGDCFQGSGVASLSQGRAIVPLVNSLGYDLVIPGNWEVVYGKAT